MTTNSYYEFVGTKIISLNKDTTTGTISTSITNTLPPLVNSQGRFKIQKFDVFVNIRNLLQAPLTYSRTKDETPLESQEKLRELISNYQHIEISYKLDNVVFMVSYAVGSKMPYYYSIYRELPLNDNQQISISLENKGWGLLTNDDIITVTMPYEYILVGRSV